MTRIEKSGSAAASLLVVVGLVAGCGPFEGAAAEIEAVPAAAAPGGTVAAADPSLLYGRVTTADGAAYEGRLRFGGDEEAYWSEYFNGVRDGNPWVEHLPAHRLQGETVEIFGIEVGRRAVRFDFSRPFMARFGDIAAIEARGRDLTVTLRSGTVVELDRWSADDFADGVRVWHEGGVVDLDEGAVRRIEFLAPTGPAAAATVPRLHGTVRTRQGDFTGFLQWDREEGVGLDALDGDAADGTPSSVPFHTIRSIARESAGGALVMLDDGRELRLSGTREAGEGHRGVYVNDPRYGRVLVPWDGVERVDFGEPAVGRGSGPAYGDFPPGRPLAGSVTTRDGRRLTGRLVYDLDETETTETLDAPFRGVDYTIPFDLVASIELAGGGGGAGAPARVVLRSGEELRLERGGDLGAGNAGLLVFIDGAERPAYVAWSEVEHIAFDRPPSGGPTVVGAGASGGPR